jgi:uncharacterized membrane protein YfcA
MEPLSFFSWLGLFFAGVAAGLVDAIAGGGGLITVPALLSTGISPAFALGTNKLQGSFGSASAAWHYRRAGLVDWRGAGTGILTTALGSGIGAILLRYLPDAVLQKGIPFLLLGVVVFLLLRPELGQQESRQRLGPHAFHVIFGLSLGFYDGFFGPGVGSFWALAFVLVLGLDLARATAHTKVMNCTSNLAALAVLAVSGKVLWFPGLLMGVGQALGARIGAGLVIRKGSVFVRRAFIGVVSAVCVRLAWSAWVSRS